MAKREPWREPPTYLYPDGSKCESESPSNWSHCPNHTFRLGELLDESRGIVIPQLELPL
jgi:hypothetical protein